MGTDTLVAANIFLILQGAAVVLSSLQGSPPVRPWSDGGILRPAYSNKINYKLPFPSKLDNEKWQELVLRSFRFRLTMSVWNKKKNVCIDVLTSEEDQFPVENAMFREKEHNPTASIRLTMDDISEVQLPRPPTVQDDVVTDTLSGAGQLRTNEIVKTPGASHQAEPVPSQPPTQSSLNFAELDKAVENAVNSLPSDDDHPLAPLVRKFNQRLYERANNSEEGDKDKLLKKLILLKLARKIQKEREAALKESQVKQDSSKNPEESQLPKDEKKKEDEDILCDCEDGCEPQPQDLNKPEVPECEEMQEQDKLKTEKSGGESNQDQKEPDGYENKINMKIRIIFGGNPEFRDGTPEGNQDGLNVSKQGAQEGGNSEQTSTHLRFALRLRVIPDNDNNIVPQITSPFETEQGIQPGEDMTLRFATRIQTASMKVIPPSSSDKDGYDRQAHIQEDPKGEITGYGASGSDDKNDQEKDARSLSMGRAPGLDVKPPTLKSTGVQTLPSQNLSEREKSKWISFRNAIMQKVIADSTKDSEEDTPNLALPQNSFPQPRLILFKVTNPKPTEEPSPSQLPPLRFPEENNEFKIREFQPNLIPGYNQAAPETKEENIFNNPINEVEENRDELPQQGNIPQDIPWFVKELISNLNKQAERRGMQPLPASLTPLPRPADDPTPVLLRALLAPYAL